MNNNLNELFENLYKKYYSMDEESRKEFIKLIQNIDELVNSNYNIKSLNKTIERKLKKKIIIKEKKYDLEHLRNYLSHGIFYQNEDDILKFGKVIWKILPDLKPFEEPIELNNFLSYIMQVSINPSDMFHDKKKIVQVYQNVFKSKNKSEQKTILLEISKRIMAEFTTEEIKNLDALLRKK
jgi:hypothetical protein